MMTSEYRQDRVCLTACFCLRPPGRKWRLPKRAAGAGPGVCALSTAFSGGPRRAQTEGSLPGPQQTATVARRQVSKGRMQPQRAGYVLHLHHAQTPEEQPGPWEGLPHPTIRLHLGCSLTCPGGIASSGATHRSLPCSALAQQQQHHPVSMFCIPPASPIPLHIQL